MLDTPSELGSVDLLADWVEASTAASTARELSQSEVEAVLAPILFEDDEVPDDRTEEEMVADIWGRLHERNALLPMYPFEVGGDRITLNSTDDDEWTYIAIMLCHYLTQVDGSHHVRTADNRDFRYVFEKLVEAAACGIFGGVSLRFGWPRDFEQDWPTHINDRVAMLADLLELDVLKLPTEEEAQAKDRSLDIVTRMRILNEDGGTGYLLIQCATGKNYQEKRSEPYVEDWDRLLDWDSHLVRAIAVPRWINTRKGLRRHFRRFTRAVVLDRSRLMHGRPAEGISAESRDNLRMWTDEQVAALPAA